MAIGCAAGILYDISNRMPGASAVNADSAKVQCNIYRPHTKMDMAEVNMYIINVGNNIMHRHLSPKIHPPKRKRKETNQLEYTDESIVL